MSDKKGATANRAREGEPASGLAPPVYRSPVEAHRPMTLERARQLLEVQAGFGGFYNANSAKLILSEVSREHGQEAVDRLIVELQLERIFGFRPGTRFAGGLALDPEQ